MPCTQITTGENNLQSAVCSLQSAVCSLRSAVWGLQSAVCSLRSAVCGLQSAICSLRSAVCSLQMSYTVLKDATLFLCNFSSNARGRASIKSAFWVFDVAFVRFKALFAILILSLIARSLFSCSRGNSTLKENWTPRSPVERLFLGADEAFPSAIISNIQKKLRSNSRKRCWAVKATNNAGLWQNLGHSLPNNASITKWFVFWQYCQRLFYTLRLYFFINPLA